MSGFFDFEFSFAFGGQTGPPSVNTGCDIDSTETREACVVGTSSEAASIAHRNYAACFRPRR